MDTALIAKHCLARESKLFAAFERRRQLLLDVAREIYPVGIAGLTRGVEEIADGYVYDEDHRLLTTAPMECLRQGAAGFHGNLTSPATRWFRFSLPSFMVKGGRPDHRQRLTLDNLTEAVEHTFERSNAYSQLHKAYEHLLAFGFACMLVSADAERVARVETLRVGTYALDIGEDGFVDTCVRRFAWTAAQIVRQFGRASCPQYILDAVDDPSKRFEVCNLVEPNACGDDRANDRVAQEIGMDESTVYRSIYFLKNAAGQVADGILKVVGFSIRPIVAPRMEYELGDVYGRGRGIDALDNCRGCQSFKFDELNIVGNQSQPAMLADAELKDEGLKMYRGAVNYTRFGEQRASMAVPVLPNPPSPDGARQERSDSLQEIARLFYNDAFSVIDAIKRGDTGRMTATEVEAHVREAMQRLAPVATIFDGELLDPLVAIMAKYTLPHMPSPLTEEDARMLADVKVEYVSAIHLAQKQTALSAIQQVLEMAGAISKMGKPDVLHRVDGDKSLVRIATLVGFPEDCLASDEEYKDAVQADREAAARQAQAEESAQAAAAAKAIGDIPLDEGHAGSQLAAAMQQGMM